MCSFSIVRQNASKPKSHRHPFLWFTAQHAREGDFQSNDLLLEWDCVSRKWTVWVSSSSWLGAGKPAYPGSVQEPRETLHQGTALWHTSFLGLSSATPRPLSCPPWRCHIGCSASCAVRTFCPNAEDGRQNAGDVPLFTRGTCVLRQVQSSKFLTASWRRSVPAWLLCT